MIVYVCEHVQVNRDLFYSAIIHLLEYSGSSGLPSVTAEWTCVTDVPTGYTHHCHSLWPVNYKSS